MDTGNSPEVRRVAIVGPECTGKSSLARFLAQHYQTLWVPEFAREYLGQINRPYTKDDLELIAKAQILQEDALAREANNVLVCDTTLLVIKIWGEFKYGTCSESILKAHATRKYDLHLLTDIDIPWENDPQREHPDKREQLFRIYKTELEKSSENFITISGSWEHRKQTAIQAVKNLILQ
jgi:NadR type nicotinamide-nucleotide adenylyltransferase